MEKLAKTCARALDFIKRHDNFLVTAHINADGDAYGAALAIAYFLKLQKKQYEIIFHDQTRDEKYDFLWGWEKIQPYDQSMQRNFGAAIVVDVPSKARIGDPAAFLPEPAHCLKIDHHPIEEEFSDFHLVDTAASSTCQLVYEIVIRSGIELDYDFANLLFTGIMYDTGRFSFSNTRQRDFEIAAHLASFGVSSNQIASRLFFSNTLEALKIVGYGLENMQSRLDGRVCVIFLPYKIMRDAQHLDIDELTNYSLAVKGVEVGIFVRQVEPNFTKVSFRSKGRVDVNQVARKFGGGGHVHAAGCRTSVAPEVIIEQIVAEIHHQLEVARPAKLVGG